MPDPVSHGQMMNYLVRNSEDKKRMREYFETNQITTASNINKPREPKLTQMFEDFNFRNKLADGGMLVKPSTDGSRPGFARSRGDPKIALTKSGEPRKGSAEKFRTYLRGLDKEVLKNSTLEDLIKNSKLNYSKTAASNVLQEDEFLKIRPKRTLNAEDKKEIKKLLKGKTGRLKSITYKGTDYYQGSDGRIREKINLKADRPEAYEIKKEREAKVRDLTKPKDVFPGITATDKNLNLQIWRDLYDSTKKRTYGPRAGDYKPPEPRLKVLTRPKNLTIDSVKTKLVLLDTKTNKKITFKNLEKYIDSLPDTSFEEMSLPYKYKNWLSSQTINYKGKTGVSLRTVLRENLLTKGELTNWKSSPYQVHHPFGKNENPFKVQLAMHKPNGLEGNIRLETLKLLDKAGTNEKDVKKILNNFEKRIKNLGGIQSGVRDVLVGEALTPDRFLRNLFAEAKIGRETRPLLKNIRQIENLKTSKAGAEAGFVDLDLFKDIGKGADRFLFRPLTAIEAPTLAIPQSAYAASKLASDVAKGQETDTSALDITLPTAVSSLAASKKFGLDLFADNAGKVKRFLRGPFTQSGVRALSRGSLFATPFIETAIQGYNARQALLKAREKYGTDDMVPTAVGMAPREYVRDLAIENQKFEGEGLTPFSAAGGGIAKLAGDRSGPPPEKGPMSQGLSGLLKRANKI